MPDDPVRTEAQTKADARLVGWQEKHEYKGDPAKWKPAEEFLQLAESQLPLARAAARTLKETNQQLVSRLQEQQEQIAGLTEAMENLKEFHTADTKRKVTEARAKLVDQLKAARAAGDVESEAEILDALTQAPQVEKTNGAEPSKKPIVEEVKEDPAFTAWRAENDWFTKDKRKRGVAIGIAEEIRADPTQNHLKGRAFYDEVGRQTEEYFASRSSGETRSNKTEGGGGAGSGDTGGGGMPKGKGYAQMPADAKAQCGVDAKKFVGKPGFKTLADWQAYYAKTYWEAEEA